MDTSEFARALRGRVREAQRAVELAKGSGDLYAIDVRVGELDSLRRAALENDVDLGDLDASSGPGGDR